MTSGDYIHQWISMHEVKVARFASHLQPALPGVSFRVTNRGPQVRQAKLRPNLHWGAPSGE